MLHAIDILFCRIRQVDETERYFAFEAGFRVPNEEEGEFMPLLLISKDPFTKVNPDGKSLASPDFMLCSAGTGSSAFALSKAYFARFVHPKNQVRAACNIVFIS